MKLNLLFTFVLLGVISALSACAIGDFPVYSAEAIEGWVVDADTKQSLEGVVITADWELQASGYFPGGSPIAGELTVMESVTDKNGRFAFPAWGPIRQFKGHLHNNAPRLIVFKSGYEYRVLSNKPRFTVEEQLEPVRRSEWNGKTIEMKPFKGTIDQYAQLVYNLDNAVDFARYGKNCEWKKIPSMLIVIHQHGQQFEDKGIKIRGWQSGTRIKKATDVHKEAHCGSPEEFFKSYLP